MVSYLRIPGWPLVYTCLLLVLLLPVVSGWAQAPARPAPEPAVGSRPAPAAEALAVVNGKPIEGSTFQEEVVGNWASRVLQDVIARRVVWDEAARLGLSITTAELNARLKALKQPYGSESAFEEMLRNTGETEEHFTLRVKTDMLLDKIVARRGSVTDAELQAYYDKHRSDYVHPPRVHLYELVTTDLAAAYAGSRRISGGEDFPLVAKEMSVAPSASTGGDLGLVSADQVPAGLLRATAFSLEAGQVSNPLLVDGKYYLLYVSEVQKGSSGTLEEVKPALLEAIKKEKGLTREAVLDALLRAASIQVVWEPLRYLNVHYQEARRRALMVDGKSVDLPLDPRIEGGRMVLVVKPMLLAMGATVKWDAQAMTLTAVKDSRQAVLTVGKPIMMAGEKAVPILAPRLQEDMVLTEPRPLVEALGGSLRWDPMRNTLFVKSVSEPETAPEPTPEG